MQTKIRTVADPKYYPREYARVFVAEVGSRSTPVSRKLLQWLDKGVRANFATCCANFPLPVADKGACSLEVGSGVRLMVYPASRLRASESSRLER
jgi:hypothetical protein